MKTLIALALVLILLFGCTGTKAKGGTAEKPSGGTGATKPITVGDSDVSTDQKSDDDLVSSEAIAPPYESEGKGVSALSDSDIVISQASDDDLISSEIPTSNPWG